MLIINLMVVGSKHYMMTEVYVKLWISQKDVLV